jgi:hypothetical protein
MEDLLSINQACDFVRTFFSRNVTPSNISYLVQYGRVRKFGDNGSTQVVKKDLIDYYNSTKVRSREEYWKDKLGHDLNWALSFDQFKEYETTKHVHRLHPYKGKFIPQLVEYFLDSHVDKFKKNVYFKQGDILLDPFMGSGTTLVQSNELGIHSVGVDVSRFNCMIAETKLLDYDFNDVERQINKIKLLINNYETDKNIVLFENALLRELTIFNNGNFPSPEYKYKFATKEIDEKKYSTEKEKEFLKEYHDLANKYQIELNTQPSDGFLNKWYIKNVKNEIDFVFDQIKKINDIKTKKILAVILSRTIRSCRATTHSDLATLKEPQTTTYYCWKHKKICKPIFSIKSWFNRYADDTLNRIKTYNELKKNSHCAIIPSDSRTVDIAKEISRRNKKLYQLFKKQKIKGIFSSPPYVGQIDYHEQHAYAYDLFGFKRQDKLEIGPLFKGKGLEARSSYIEGISDVLNNCRKYLASDFDVFLVANDKYNIYQEIVRRSGMKIINQFKRPVLNRTERDKSPYSEIIFHIKNIG